MKSKLPNIIVICGPTATGKSDLAVDMARRFKGEVVSADSRQVYAGMNIGSGKITRREMKGVTHHLLDVADPRRDRYTVENFRQDASAAIRDILSRGKLPIVCGGTGFYIDALVFDEQFPDVPPDQALRRRLERKTAAALMKELRKLDPRRARSVDPLNKVRIIRAIEIARTLGKVPPLRRRSPYDALWIGLTLSREELREKIHKRLIKRIKAGMIDEVARLHKRGVTWKRLHSFGLEYRFVALLLQKKLTRKGMIDGLETEIAQFAKRQMTWFKRNKKIAWLAPGKNDAAARLIRQFLA